MGVRWAGDSGRDEKQSAVFMGCTDLSCKCQLLLARGDDYFPAPGKVRAIGMQHVAVLVQLPIASSSAPSFTDALCDNNLNWGVSATGVHPKVPLCMGLPAG